MARARSCSHGRLFGCDGEVQHVHQHEAERVVETVGQPLDQWRQVQFGRENLDQCHESDDKAGAHRRDPHAEVALTVSGDVMLAGTTRVFGDTQCKQAEQVREVAAHAATTDFSADRRADQRCP